MEELEKLREEIDQIDETLIRALAMRFRITDKIGAIKKTEKLPAIDPQRKIKQEKRVLEIAKEAGLRGDIAISFLRLIIATVVENHKKA